MGAGTTAAVAGATAVSTSAQAAAPAAAAVRRGESEGIGFLRIGSAARTHGKRQS
ncbi:hypothetical protein GCM10022200_23850 [Microbacterium awajiense]|uniref:Uncharacterized protein n=1 Tax=Microbacterium awajiense TaxID=415214 RepID=A0ABP7ASR5_9MICO